MPKHVKTMDGYDETSPDKTMDLAKQASEQFFTYICVENADQKKCGTVLKNLNSQKSLGSDQHPKKLIEATNMLSNHCYDSSKSRTNSQRSRGHNNNNNEKEQEADEVPMLPFHQMEGKCYCCGKAGHKSPKCPNSSSAFTLCMAHSSRGRSLFGHLGGLCPSLPQQ